MCLDSLVFTPPKRQISQGSKLVGCYSSCQTTSLQTVSTELLTFNNDYRNTATQVSKGQKDRNIFRICRWVIKLIIDLGVSRFSLIEKTVKKNKQDQS